MNRDAFAEAFDVPRETMERLDVYVGLLQKWSGAINLLGPTEADYLWERHISDCGQLIAHVPENAATWLDLGSGAGLPGLVMAILCSSRAGAITFDLLDADKRKGAFLREAGRQTATAINVIAERTEDVSPRAYDVVSARAFAPLRRLLRHAAPFVSDRTTLLLHKGRNVRAELEDASEEWEVDAEILPSLTDQEGAILRISRFVGLT